MIYCVEEYFGLMDPPSREPRESYWIDESDLNEYAAKTMPQITAEMYAAVLSALKSTRLRRKPDEDNKEKSG